MEVLVYVPVSGHGIPHQEEVSAVGSQSLLAYLEQLSRNCTRSSIKSTMLTLCMRIMKYFFRGTGGKEPSVQFDFNLSLLKSNL